MSYVSLYLVSNHLVSCHCVVLLALESSCNSAPHWCTHPKNVLLAEVERLFCPHFSSVAPIHEIDVTLFLSVYTHTRSGVKGLPASIKTNVTHSWMRCCCITIRLSSGKSRFQRTRAGSDFGVFPTAIRGWRNLRQPPPVRAEKHHHCLPVLWRERHLPSGHLHQHSRAEVHQHKHPVHPHQPLQSLKGTVPARPGGRSRDRLHL